METGYSFNQQYCGNRLPCGICKMTNSMCPLWYGQIDISWTGTTTTDQSKITYGTSTEGGQTNG